MLAFATLNKDAIELLKEEAAKIQKLIEAQVVNLKMPQCPLYEDVLDTQLLGFSKQVDFAVRLGLVSDIEGKNMINSLEKKLLDIVGS